MKYKVSNCYFAKYNPPCIMCMAAVWRRPWMDVSALPRKFQHGGDWEWSRPHDPKNVHNFLIAVRPLSWACGHGTKMLLILKKTFFNLITPRYFPIWQSKEMSHDFVRGQSVAETCGVVCRMHPVWFSGYICLPVRDGQLPYMSGTGARNDIHPHSWSRQTRDVEPTLPQRLLFGGITGCNDLHYRVYVIY